jgi:iron-sulfur cluster assembly accessory protein
MIHLTDSAVDAMRTAISGAGKQGLRIAVQSGGCSGLKYQLGLVSEGAPHDIVLEQGGVTVFVEPESEPHLKGTVVDFVTSVEGSGFTFDNPNAKSRCGCGKSFC